MKKILFALALMAATLVSCSKDNGGNGDGSEKLVSEIIITPNDDYSQNVTFEYDEQSRIKKIHIIYSYEGLAVENHERTFEYDDNTFTETIAGEGYTFIYYLDDNGYVIKSESIIDANMDSYSTYEYENGKIRKIYTYYSGNTSSSPSIEEYIWQGEDIVKISNSRYNSRYAWQYSIIEDKTNISPLSFYSSAPSGSIKYKGTYSKHLPISNGEDNYTYEFDPEGYPIKITEKSNSGDYIVEYNIKYY